MKNRYIATGSLSFLLAGAACATAMPPKELIAAREAYAHAQQGATAQLDPADLHTAAKALAAAEGSFQRDGDTPSTRDLAYVAQRRVQIADAKASALQANAAEQNAVSTMHAAREDQAKQVSAQLGRANQQLQLQGQELASERDAHAEAEKRAAQATADLQKFASVKQETRGMVITLSGGVLFASGKFELLPAAQVKLNSVAEALATQDPDSKMTVEGHTDSQGTVAFNNDLSQKRAQTVRDYLVSRGIANDRVTAEGFGSSRSVADNTSPEGRANNRRVEIVVGPKAARAM
jgi:outer membrane protein OmpA-like peptidoglycan-associated protein